MYVHPQNADAIITKLVQDLIRQLEKSQQQVESLHLDHEREIKYLRENETRENELRSEMDRMRTLLDRNAFVTVLIDGDSLMFSKDVLQKGFKGGEEAAKLMLKTLNNLTKDILPHMLSVTVHAKLYTDYRALSENLLRSKAIDNQIVLDDFFRGLISSELQFEIVDTRLMKTLTSAMIKQSYRQDFINVHCHQIFLATLRNDDMDALMEEIPEISVRDRVTVFEIPGLTTTEQFSRDMGHVNLGSLLVKTNAETIKTSSAKIATPILPLARVVSSSSPKSTSTTAIASISSTPVLSWAALTAQPFHPKLENEKSRSSTPLQMKTPPISKVVPDMPKNKYGQRVDAVDSSIPYQELQRIKKMKLCNIYYLQGKDACNGNCGHSHTYPLKAYERNVLKEVARMTPCYYKLDCDDPSCIYGHRCPQNKPGKKDCFFKDDCRFVGWGHGIDEQVVKTTNIKG